MKRVQYNNITCINKKIVTWNTTLDGPISDEAFGVSGINMTIVTQAYPTPSPTSVPSPSPTSQPSPSPTSQPTL